MQRIQYAKTKSDCIADADGSLGPKEKKKKQDDKGDWNYLDILNNLEFFNWVFDVFH